MGVSSGERAGIAGHHHSNGISGLDDERAGAGRSDPVQKDRQSSGMASAKTGAAGATVVGGRGAMRSVMTDDVFAPELTAGL